MKNKFSYAGISLLFVGCIASAASPDFNGVGGNIEALAQQARGQAKTVGGSAPAGSSRPLVLKCSAHVLSLQDGGKPDDMTFSIFKNKDSYDGEIVHLIDGKSSTDHQAVTYTKDRVRAGLTPDTDPYTVELNEAEGLIVHAMALTRDPEFRARFSIDFDLDKARSAQVYLLGEATRFGSASLVVASDEKGAVLGPFLGGFIVASCK